MEISQQEEWRFVLMGLGAQSVTTSGTIVMPGLCADNLDYQMNVRGNYWRK